MTQLTLVPNAADTLLAETLVDEAMTPLERMEAQTRRAWNLPDPAPGGEAVKVSQPGDTPPSVRTIARKGDIDIASLINILEYQRPAGSTTEEMFSELYVGQLPGIQRDGYGNFYLTIGADAPTVLWSCHTDTVARNEGKQNIRWDGDYLVVNQPNQGQVLGADDGAGLWLMLEMIKANVPGLYVFHRDEEIGCKGSRWLLANNKKLLDGIKHAIAFDRKRTFSIITKQRGGRCCSDEFGQALADKFNQIEGLEYKLDPTGVFTDTAIYVDDVPECTNVSCGYYDEHSSKEKLDVRHLLRLREALITQDFSDLPVKRDPTEVDDDDWYGSYGGYGGYSGGYGRHSNTSNTMGARPYGSWKNKSGLEALYELVHERPYTVAQMLFNMGMNAEDLNDMLGRVWQRTPAKGTATTIGKPAASADAQTAANLRGYLANNGHTDPDEDEPLYVDMLFCNDCQDFCDPKMLIQDPEPGDACTNCYRSDTELMEVEVDPVSGEPVQ